MNKKIYYSICIENNVKGINIIYDNIKKIISNNDLSIIFKPEGNKINNFLEKMKKFGNLDIIKNNEKEKKWILYYIKEYSEKAWLLVLIISEINLIYIIKNI